MATPFDPTADSEDVEAHLCSFMARMSISRDTTTKIGGRFRNVHLNQQQSRASVGLQCNLGAEAAAPSCFSRASSTTRKRGFDEAFQPPSNDNVITSPSTKSICFPSATVHIFHDSNFKGVSTEDLAKQIDAINGGKKFVSEWFFHLTFTLPNTLKKVKETVFGRDDLVVVNIMTNHARLQHPVERTQRLLSAILDELLQRLGPKNVTLLAAPPLNVSPYTDISVYNRMMNETARQRSVNYVESPLKISQLSRDGFHIQQRYKGGLLCGMAVAVNRMFSHQLQCSSNPS